MRGLTNYRVRNPGSLSVPGSGVSSGGGVGNSSWTSFTAALTATTTNPTLGTGGVLFLGETYTTQAAYIKMGDITVARYTFAFGSGATPGEGIYKISFPNPLPCVFDFAPVDWTGNWLESWPIIGQGKIYDSVQTRVGYVQCWANQVTNTTFSMRTSHGGEGTGTTSIAGPGYFFGETNFGPGSLIQVEVYYPTVGYNLGGGA